MTSTQSAEPIISGLERVLEALETGSVDGRPIVTQEVLFDFHVDSSDLRAEHGPHLVRFAEVLEEHPDATVVAVVGHASQTGPESNNESLAFGRAESVRTVLIAAGISPLRIGPTVASGSETPIIDTPGQEAAMNRSVQLIVEWQVPLVKPVPDPDAGLSTRWKLEPAVVVGGDRHIGGELIIGRLKNLTTNQSRAVGAFFVGIDITAGLPVTAEVDVVHFPIGEQGVITTPNAVDWNWFDARPIGLLGAEASAIVAGIDGMAIFFFNGETFPPWTWFASSPIGVTLDIGARGMLGFLNVSDT